MIFPCKGTASVQPSSTATLTDSRIERQPSQIEDEPPVPRRVGYSVKSLRFPCLTCSLHAVCPACKIFPDKEAEEGFQEKGRKMFNDTKIQDYAQQSVSNHNDKGKQGLLSERMHDHAGR